MSLDNKDHRSVFDALIQGHPGMSEAAVNNMYAAQVLWDEAMADTLVKYIGANPPGKSTVYVVIAGAGHIMYGQGIDYRLKQRGYTDQLIVVMLQSNEPMVVSNGIADFVYVTPAQKTG